MSIFDPLVDKKQAQGIAHGVMARLPHSTRVIFLVIALAATLIGIAWEIQRRSSASFLEEGWESYQAKFPAPMAARLSQSVLSESLTVGRLMAADADPEHWSEEAIRDLSLYIVLKSRQYRLSPIMVLSLIQVESRFQPMAVSPRGAVGLMQLMPGTAEELALNLGVPFHGPGALQDPKLNIELGLRYITSLKDRFGSNEQMLTAYNIGPAALEKKLRNGEDLPLSYYRKVMGVMEDYRSQAREQSEVSTPPRAKASRTWL